MMLLLARDHHCQCLVACMCRVTCCCAHLHIVSQAAGHDWDVDVLPAQRVQQPHHSLSRHSQQPVVPGLRATTSNRHIQQSEACRPAPRFSAQLSWRSVLLALRSPPQAVTPRPHMKAAASPIAVWHKSRVSNKVSCRPSQC